MLEQVLMNLSVNARDAMPKGGTVTIETSSMELNDSFVQSHPEARPGSFICLRVTDNGCGMDSATMSRIFEPFFTTKDSKGTGLGLWVSQGIIQKHGGTLRVRSCVHGKNQGTCFSVFLPFAVFETHDNLLQKSTSASNDPISRSTAASSTGDLSVA